MRERRVTRSTCGRRAPVAVCRRGDRRALGASSSWQQCHRTPCGRRRGPARFWLSAPRERGKGLELARSGVEVLGRGGGHAAGRACQAEFRGGVARELPALSVAAPALPPPARAGGVP
jgi:hypothetical protein